MLQISLKTVTIAGVIKKKLAPEPGNLYRYNFEKGAENGVGLGLVCGFESDYLYHTWPPFRFP